MHLRLGFRFLAPAIFCAVRLCHPAAAEKLLFDFQGAADLKAWSQFLPDSPQVPGAKEPPVKIELSGENAAAGKRCLKLAYSGGKYPTVATHSPLDDWTAYQCFKADVTASRTCLVAFRVVREDDKEHRGWVKLALLHQDRNEVVDVAPTPNRDLRVGKGARICQFIHSQCLPWWRVGLHCALRTVWLPSPATAIEMRPRPIAIATPRASTGKEL
jgi:hypothetical protein